jgi:hypothetical protein
MVKKIVLGTLLVGLIGVLVAGGIIRTIDKTDNVAEARGLGRGQGNSETVDLALNGNGQRGGGSGQGSGYGRSAVSGERQYPNYETAPEDWVTVEGTVVQAPAAGVDLVIATESGEEIVIGTGPSYMETQGFTLQADEQVQVQGYWQDGEFKAAQVTRLLDGQTLTLRDQLGRPAWAGNGQRATGQTPALPQAGQGQGSQGQGSVDAPGDGTGTGQAQVDEWLTLQGTVASVTSDELVVQTTGGEQVLMDGRPWRFAQEAGFSAQAGDQLVLVGFYEDGDFEVGQIENLASGQVVPIRDEDGRPLWAGRGWRSG